MEGCFPQWFATGLVYCGILMPKQHEIHGPKTTVFDKTRRNTRILEFSIRIPVFGTTIHNSDITVANPEKIPNPDSWRKFPETGRRFQEMGRRVRTTIS